MCFFCVISNAKNCGVSCGLCGEQCPGYDGPPTGIPNGMTAKDYEFSEM